MLLHTFASICMLLHIFACCCCSHLLLAASALFWHVSSYLSLLLDMAEEMNLKAIATSLSLMSSTISPLACLCRSLKSLPSCTRVKFAVSSVHSPSQIKFLVPFMVLEFLTLRHEKSGGHFPLSIHSSADGAPLQKLHGVGTPLVYMQRQRH